MECVVVLIKNFKKDCRVIRVVATKVSSYFITRLLDFNLHFQYRYVENEFILLFKDG